MWDPLTYNIGGTRPKNLYILEHGQKYFYGVQTRSNQINFAHNNVNEEVEAWRTGVELIRMGDIKKETIRPKYICHPQFMLSW